MSRWHWKKWLPVKLDRNEARAAEAREHEITLAERTILLDRRRVELDQLNQLTEATLRGLGGHRVQ